MNISNDLLWRGLIKDKTFEDPSWLDTPRKFYLGIDASGDSMTIGNLAVILLARRLVEAGWQAVMLAGGATSLVGDPGGKEDERQLKTPDEIAKNVEAVKVQIEKFFAGQPHEMVNNIDWLGEEKYLDFLRDVGKYYSMTELLQRDFVTARLGQDGSGISYAEFSYSLLQGFDFWWLFKNKGVELQIGASDQWGNMLSGVPLIRKKESKEVHAFSMPLVIDRSTGRKFGKSEAGAICLDPAKTSETQFRQFWINVTDEEVGDFLKIYTFITKDEFDKLMAEHATHPEQRLAQNELSKRVTEIVFGSAASSFSKIQQLLTGELSLEKLDPELLADIKKEIPVLKSTGNVVEALVSGNLTPSNSEARRLLASGAVYINGVSVDRDNFENSDFKNGFLLLRRGKAYKDSILITE